MNLSKLIETTIDDDLVYLVCYAKAVDLWIAEQGVNCCEDKTVIKEIARQLREEFYEGKP
jgi:hypothetical protein